MMQRKRKARKERRKKECVIWGRFDGAGKRKIFWALERKQWTMQGKRNAWKERREKKEYMI